MSESVIIFGCGYVGLELARHCMDLGWSVSAFTRNEKTAKEAEKIGVNSFLGQLHTNEWWQNIPNQFDHVVNLVGASNPSVEGYRESYITGMNSIVGWMENAQVKAKNLVFSSSSSVYPQTDGSLVDEESDTKGASARGEILLDAENICLHSSKDQIWRSSVVRFSGLYGPGRHLLVDKICRGESMSGRPDRVLNLIHRYDAASAVLSILQSGNFFNGGILNVCDGQHATRGEIVRWVAERAGVAVPEFKGIYEDRGPHRRVNSFKIRDQLGWSPNFPDFQTGYEDFLASE